MWARALSPVASFAVGLGFQVSGFQHPVLGWALIALGVVLAVICWAPPIWRYVGRVRLTLKPEKGQVKQSPNEGWSYWRLPDGRGLVFLGVADGRFWELIDGAADYFEQISASNRQQKVYREMGHTNKWQYTKRDLIRLVDRTESFLLDLGDGIDEGTALTNRLHSDIPDEDIRAFQQALGKASSVRQLRLKPIEEWEGRMSRLLEFRRDSKADFMRPVPLEPTGQDELIYRVQVRLERLSGFRAEVAAARDKL
jgi:hypothetical protein